MKILILLSFLTFSLSAFSMHEQIQLERVEMMPAVPQPLKIINFKQMSLDFDAKVFDPHQQGEHWPLIWRDLRSPNTTNGMNGIFTTIGDIRQGKNKNGGGFHEALTSMGAILGASLNGIDKSESVKELRGYFNHVTGWNIMQNNTDPVVGALGGGYGRDWWYDIFPNVLYFSIFDHYQNDSTRETARSIADKFLSADQILNGNYHSTYFDYAKMVPVNNWICTQPDAAAGHAYVLYAAYHAFGDQKYLAGAKNALTALEKNKTNPAYEVLMPFGALVAARLNAEEGTDYDVEKLLNWTFNPSTGCRKGWGVLADKWNGYDVSGLMGSVTDHGGYGFVMNTYDMAWPLIPLIRYDQRFAYTLGKWMLNAANAVKLAYPQHTADIHQTLPHKKEVTKGVIAYEGVVKHTTHAEYESTTRAPVAQGDGPKWLAGNPDVSQFSVYGSAHVGIFGSIIQKTEVEGILKLNLLATDTFHDKAYPTSLIFNPFHRSHRIKLSLPAGKFDIYETLSGRFVKEAAQASAILSIPGDSARVFVIVPHAGKIERKGKQTLVNGVVIDYQTKTKWFRGW